MQPISETMIQELVATIVREVNPEAVILFGSQARGDARPDSDVDVLIIDPEPFTPRHSRRQETARLYLALRKLGVAKDLLLYSRAEFERFRNSTHHIIGRAQREGRVVYGGA